MNWNKLVNEIEKDIESRSLKDLPRRLSGLKSIANIIDNHFHGFIDNPSESFNSIDKKDLESLMATHKQTGKLNGAEKSILNEIYKRV